MNKPIAITALSSISSLGSTGDEIWNEYINHSSLIFSKKIGDNEVMVSSVKSSIDEEIKEIQNSEIKYKFLDRSVLFAILVSRKAVSMANWNEKDIFGINIGSSRGATELFENHHKEFIETGKAQTLASPTTTLGNISTWVAHDLKSKGPEISHSITCSTALHSVLNGIAWLRSGMADKFLVGGSEAPLTPFTIAQMKALKIYTKETDDYPCKALDLNKTKNTMVLGEGAAVICLESGYKENALAYIDGVGYATDDLQHGISITEDADCFQKSMKMAIGEIELNDIDLIVMHAPGTIKGDSSEYNAIKKIFGDKIPMLTTNKWKIGHTFGASGLLSLEFAIMMLQKQKFIQVPFIEKQEERKSIKKVLVNAVGFGGNAVSVLLTK